MFREGLLMCPLCPHDRKLADALMQEYFGEDEPPQLVQLLDELAHPRALQSEDLRVTFGRAG
eukprot:4487138-Amphidinium_carterae.1